MEKFQNDADRMIDRIDQELLKLYYVSQNKTEYQFFDFFGALRLLNEYILKDGGRKEYFNLKMNQYRCVFYDLLFTESEISSYEFLNYNIENQTAKYKITAYFQNQNHVKEEIKEIKIADNSHEYFLKKAKGEYKDLPSKRKYAFLLQDCIIEDKTDFAWNHNFRKRFDELFSKYNLDIKTQMTFEDYIDRLQVYKKPNAKKSPLIFEVSILKPFYFNLDDYLWEHIEWEVFLNCFRVSPDGNLVFKKGMITYFCFALGLIENKILKEHKPTNFKDWIKPLINGNNYSSMKNRENLDQNKINEIKSRLSFIA